MDLVWLILTLRNTLSQHQTVWVWWSEPGSHTSPILRQHLLGRLRSRTQRASSFCSKTFAGTESRPWPSNRLPRFTKISRRMSFSTCLENISSRKNSPTKINKGFKTVLRTKKSSPGCTTILRYQKRTNKKNSTSWGWNDCVWSPDFSLHFTQPERVRGTTSTVHLGRLN